MYDLVDLDREQFCGHSKRGVIRTALYIHTFFIAPTRGLRICPYDGEQFFQDRPNQEYCTPAHREAHRVKRARWRKKIKELEAQQSQKGVKNGSHKAR